MKNLLSAYELAAALETTPSVFLFPEDRGGTTLMHAIPGRSSEYVVVNRVGMTFFSPKLPGCCCEILMDDDILARVTPTLIAQGERMARERRAPVNEVVVEIG